MPEKDQEDSLNKLVSQSVNPLDPTRRAEGRAA